MPSTTAVGVNSRLRSARSLSDTTRVILINPNLVTDRESVTFRVEGDDAWAQPVAWDRERRHRNLGNDRGRTGWRGDWHGRANKCRFGLEFLAVHIEPQPEARAGVCRSPDEQIE